MNMKRARNIYKRAYMDRVLLKEETHKSDEGGEQSHTVRTYCRIPKEGAPGFRTWARKNENIKEGLSTGKLACILRGQP